MTDDVPTTPPAGPRPKGLFCPLCRGLRLITTSRRRPAPGIRIKYIRCESCQARLKLRETIVAVTRPGTVPTPGTPA